ncbi:MAG: LysR family transcriptional regulator [Curvibacter sp.]|nr:LysR family transcriptional regulator [Curvibacter sp.]
MDQLKAMRTFVRVIDEGSFAAAARALDLAPAVVTRLVAHLEELLGARLLNRTTRSIALTDVGEKYLDRVRQILAEVDEAHASVAKATGELRGVLHLASPLPFVQHQLAPLLPEFRQRYPHVELDIEVITPTGVPSEDADVTLLLEGHTPISGDFVVRRLARAEVVLCATPDYLRRHRPPKHPQDLAEHDILVPNLAMTPREWVFRRQNAGADEAAQEQHALTPRLGAIGSNSTDALFAAALAGMGIFGALSFTVDRALRQGLLQRVLHDWQLGAYTLYLGLPSRKYMPSRTRVFCDFLLEKFGGTQHDPWLAAL